MHTASCGGGGAAALSQSEDPGESENDTTWQRKQQDANAG